jgi:hypothetical protein
VRSAGIPHTATIRSYRAFSCASARRELLGNSAQVVWRRLFDMEMNPIRRTSSGGIGGWWRGGGKQPSRWFESASPRAPRPWQKPFAAELVEIGQGKHHMRSHQVFGQAAIAHFGEAPQLVGHSSRRHGSTSALD